MSDYSPPQERCYHRMPHVGDLGEGGILARRGRINLPTKALEQDPVVVLAVMAELIVTRCEYFYSSQRFEYEAMSPHFEPLQAGDVVPFYCVTVHCKADHAEKPFVEFSRLSEGSGFDEMLMLEQPRVVEAESVQRLEKERRKRRVQEQQERLARAAHQTNMHALGNYTSTAKTRDPLAPKWLEQINSLAPTTKVGDTSSMTLAMIEQAKKALGL